MRADLQLDTSAGPTVPARTDANKRCRRTIPTAHMVRRPLFLYSFGTDSIADAQQPAELVDGASAFIDQSGICQIARSQPIAVVAFYLKRPPRMGLMPSLEPSFRTRSTTRQAPKKCALSFGLMPISNADLRR